MERRLAAILAADVVGYARLMGADEAGTLAALRELRADVFDPTIAKHNGRIVKLMGDGALVEFSSVVDAVNCAVAVQDALSTRNAGLPEDRRLALRIGINLGDVMVEGDDLYGDGVNVAARLEGIADPGGICVSDAVAQQARGKVDVGFEDQGEQSLKNIAEPVRVWRVTEQGQIAATPPARRRSSPRVWYGIAAALLLLVAGGWWAAKDVLAPEATAAIDVDQVLTIKGPAIAALPFENLSGDDKHDLFAQGISNQLAAALTRFKGVRVLSPRASAKFANDLQAMHRELGAEYLLEGSLRRGPDEIQITAVLTKVETGDQIWTESFTSELSPTNIVDTQDKLAGKIAGAIADVDRGAVSLDRVSDRGSRPPSDQNAFDCVVESNNFLDQERVRKGYRCLLSTLARDPSYAAGWSRISELYSTSYHLGTSLADGQDLDLLKLALEAGQKAVEFAPQNAEAHFALAYASFFNGDHKKLLSEAAEVIRLNPNNANAIGFLGMYIAFTGRWEEGVALCKKAREFNPSVVSLFAQTNAPAKWHFLKGEYSDAEEEFRPLWDAFSGFWLIDVQKAYVYAAWGKQAQAEDAVSELLKKRPDYTIEDAVHYYRVFQFQQSFIDKMVAALKKAGLPSRDL